MTALRTLCWLALWAPFSFCAEAAVPEAEAAKLGTELTPLGAEKAGTADGTIPAWTGGIVQPPAAHKPDDTYYQNPFADDRPLFTITASNLEQHQAHLSSGQVELLKRYPKAKMNVYPTRRSASLPARLYEGTRKNALTAKLNAGGSGFENAGPGIPFPIPHDGNEAIWNHLFRYRGDGVERRLHNINVNPDGSYVLGRVESSMMFLYKPQDNRIFVYRQHMTAPARVAGTVVLVYEPLNQAAELRSTWVYSPGLRRVRRVTNVAYDTPMPDGVTTTDEIDMFNGDVSRYDWKLLGKKELYVPYNNYALQDPKLDYDKLIQPGHLNGDFLRYELHRVWEVEATVKKGTRHIYPHRIFYLDEDTWQLVLSEQYDVKDKLWQVGEGYAMNYYDVPLTWYAAFAYFDVQSGRYMLWDINNNRSEKSYRFVSDLGMQNFTPASLVREGMR